MEPSQESTKEELLEKLYATFCVGVRSAKSTTCQKWLEKKGLSWRDIDVAFNSGQFHHRKDEVFRKQYTSIGVLKESDANVKMPGLKAYTCFGAFGIIFPLKNEQGQIVNLYSIRIGLETEKTEYLNDDGLYPGYPGALTTRLYLTHDVLSAATLLQSKTLENRDAVLALKEGILQVEHIDAISQLKHLNEITFVK